MIYVRYALACRDGSEPKRGSVGSFTNEIAVFVRTRRYRVSVLTRLDKLKFIGHPDRKRLSSDDSSSNRTSNLEARRLALVACRSGFRSLLFQ